MNYIRNPHTHAHTCVQQSSPLMSKFDEYLPALRQAAYARLQAKHPAFYLPQYVSGIEDYAVRSSDAMVKSLDTWFTSTGKIISPDALVRMWPLVDRRAYATFFSRDSVRLGAALKTTDSSINEMSLIAGQLIDPDMRALADGRDTCIIKSQALIVEDPADPGKRNKAVFEFTNEVMVSRMLNGLVTAFQHTVTPHFTTFLGCFAAPDVLEHSSTVKPTRIYSLYERANLSVEAVLLEDLRTEDARTVERTSGIIFQTVSALQAAMATAGVAHNDLHTGNVMIRDVKGTVYADRPWGYKLLAEAEFKFIPAAVHRNEMVEIIDQGRATVTPSAPSTREAHARFLADVRHFLAHVVSVSRDDPIDDPTIAAYFDALARFVNKMPGKSLDHIGVGGKAMNHQATLAWASQFWDKWATDDPTFGLGFLFAPILTAGAATTWVDYIWDKLSILAPRENTATKPIAVSIVPVAYFTLAETEHEMAPTLRRLWKLPHDDERRGMKRAFNFDACRTCGSAPRFETADAHAHPFCGKHCYEVFAGLMDTV